MKKIRKQSNNWVNKILLHDLAWVADKGWWCFEIQIFPAIRYFELRGF